MTEPISSRPPRRSGGRLLGWLPLIPPLSVLTVGALRDWRSLPGTLRAALLLFVLTQVVAALLSPQPMVSLLLGGLRGAVICGLVAYGARAGRDLNLRPFALGVAALCVAALVTQSLLGWRTPQGTFRALEFVYANANSLSVLGVLLVCLALWDRSWGAWRWPLGTLGLAVAVLGQGRMAWLACAVGLLAAWRGRRATLTRSALLLLALGALAWAPARQALVTVLGPAISGREAVWETAARVADRWPWGGAGAYQYGAQAQAFPDGCAVPDTLTRLAPGGCPAWLTGVRQPFLIAHNGVLHVLAESGRVGLPGWLILWGTLLWGAWRSGWPLARAVVAGMLTMNVLDNATIIPSVGYAELFFVLGGAAYAAVPHSRAALGLGLLTGAALGVLTLLAPWVLGRPAPLPPVTLRTLLLPPTYQAGEVYAIYTDLHISTVAPLYLAIEQCDAQQRCLRIGGSTIPRGSVQDWVYARLRPGGEQRLRLVLSDAQRTANGFVLREWVVQRAP